MRKFTPVFVGLIVCGMVAAARAGDRAKPNVGAASIAAQSVPAPDAVWLAKAIAAYPLDACVVGGDKLGGDMGEPFNFVYRQPGQPDRLVRFCCQACVSDFTANPAKFLKMIDDAAAAAKAKKN